MPALLGPVLPAIQGPARLRRTTRHHHRPHVRCLENAERRIGEVLGALDEFETEPEIGLIRTETAHRVGIRHPRDRPRQVIADQCPQRGQDLFGDRHHIVGVDEAHLHIELGELRLTVGAKILIAITAGDLVVPLHPGHHQQLLEQLRTLRQRVERAGLQPGGHQEVTRALGCGPGQRRCLDFNEVVGGQDRPGRGVDPRTQPDRVAGSAFSTHIQVAVFQPGFLPGRFVKLEGQWCALSQHRQCGRVDLDISGGDLSVGITLGPDLDHTGDDDAELCAQPVRLFEHAGIPEHHLGDTGGIAKVDEDHPAVVTAAGHPARQGDLLAGIGGPQRTGGMTAQH